MESVEEILRRSETDKSLMNIEESSRSDEISASSGPPELPGGKDGRGKPECPKCGGLGYIIPDVALTDPLFGRAVDCTCRDDDRESARYERLKNLSESTETSS